MGYLPSGRRRLRGWGPALLAAVLATPGCREMRPGDLLVENVRIFDPVSGTFAEAADVLIRGDRIAAVGDLGSPDSGVTHVDAAGKYALPGLWDAHVHLSFLHLNGGDSAVVATLAGFVRNGVTAVRDVGGPLDTIAPMSSRVERGEIVGPRIYFTGPLLSQAPLLEHIEAGNQALPGLAAVVESPADVDRVLDGLVARGARITKAIDPWDPALFRHFVEAARTRSLKVIFDADLATSDIPIDTALALGVTSFEHSKVVWSGVLRDDLQREVDASRSSGKGATSAALQKRIMTLGEQSVSRERLTVLAENWARRGAYLTPNLAFLELLRDTSEKDQRPFDALVAVNQLFVRELSARGVRMLVGQDNFEPDETWKEMDALAAAGVSPLEILRGATLYPAQFLGLEDSAGTITRGRRADLVILDANPLERIQNIRSVWRVVYRGRIFPR